MKKIQLTNKSLIAAIAILVIAIGGLILMSQKTEEPKEGEDAKFSGTIQEISYNCYRDGTCSMIVDGKYILWGRGMTDDPIEPLGQIIGDISNGKGKRIEAFVKFEGGKYYTLYGSEKYYIKLLG